MPYLKKLRVFISLFFFIVIALFFLDFRHYFSEGFISGILFLQFTPSVLLFIKTFGLVAIGFILIIILTFFFGRVYCSSICPLGTLQDFFSRFSNRFIIKRKRYRYSKAQNILRYGILGITVLLFILGSALLVNLLDPYSNFGRLFTYLGKPVVVEANNFLSRILGNWGYYGLYPVNLPAIRIEVILVSLLVPGVVIWLSFWRGRLYCNTVCPVGAILGLFSRFSLVKISIDEKSCNQCGKCAAVCKAECMDIKNKEVDFTRCVACYNCLTACPENGVKYSMVQSGRKPTEETVNVEKRNFILTSLVVFLGLSKWSYGAGDIKNAQATTIKEDKNHPVSPPGSVSIEGFNQACTACTLCVSICPTHVLQPSFMEYGLGGLLQPRMDYHAGFCNFDCVKCSEICPTGAILPINLDQKHTTQIGVVRFIKENCIVHTDRTDCGACSEHCPTKAVDMVPYEDGLFIPEVTEDICIGCGACEYACPTEPYRAIFVDGNQVHELAKKPEVDELDQKVDFEDFPF